MPAQKDDTETLATVLINRDEHRAAKARAALEGKTLRDWLEEVIREAVKNGARR